MGPASPTSVQEVGHRIGDSERGEMGGQLEVHTRTPDAFPNPGALAPEVSSFRDMPLGKSSNSALARNSETQRE